MSQEDIAQRFGEACRKLRTRKGLSQEEFAYTNGLDRSYVGSVERGERNPSLRVIERFAVALGVPLSKLFREVEKGR